MVNSTEDVVKKPKRESHVLALNSGSSSLKFGLYRVSAGSTLRVIVGEAEAIGKNKSAFHAKDAKARTLLQEQTPIPSQLEAVKLMANLLRDRKMPVPESIGHRIVHGGAQLMEHCRIDEAVLRQLEAAAVFAPLHMPAALSVIRLAQSHFPGVKQVACFDTSFHAHMPLIARALPIPRALRAEGVQRYGFHGLSCESIVRQLTGSIPGRLIIAHLGNGASVTAVKDGNAALEALSNEKFDLLLTDIVMPDFDGIALSLKVAKDYPDTRIVMMSGYANQRQRAHNLDFLAHEVISKPFTLDEIIKRITAALA